MTIDQNERIRLLAELCRELTRLGLTVGMSDAKPALSVRLGISTARLWISIGTTGEFFEWHGGGHPVTEPGDAARRIADHVGSRAP